MNYRLYIPLIILLLFTPPVQGADRSGIGIDEKLGRYIPSDLLFYDEKNNAINLKEHIDRPVIILPVYYSCANICNVLLGSLAHSLDNMDASPGKDYKVITLSFDEKDTPETALNKKNNYMASFKNQFVGDNWKFLTGDSKNIKSFTDSIGFSFKRTGNHFQHPSALIVLSSERKIVRYLYGDSYLPFDLKMAIIEAQEGRVGPSISKVLKYCFSYDPHGRKYVFNILKVSASLILLFALGFVTFLIITGKKRVKDNR